MPRTESDMAVEEEGEGGLDTLLLLGLGVATAGTLEGAAAATASAAAGSDFAGSLPLAAADDEDVEAAGAVVSAGLDAPAAVDRRALL
jgi:hypothetical protein